MSKCDNENQLCDVVLDRKLKWIGKLQQFFFGGGGLKQYNKGKKKGERGRRGKREKEKTF